LCEKFHQVDTKTVKLLYQK